MPDSEESYGAAGIGGILRRIGATLIAILRTRIELAAAEIEEQGLRAAELAVLAVAAIFFFCLAVIFGTLTLAVAFWSTDPVLVLGAITGFYLVLAAALGLILRQRAKRRPRLLAATIAELARDGEELTR
ncbi:MAG: phage holin family protein [Pseudomonadota bacterium]|nr:phage holin family protein [Pseudomonadota bacterium]